MRADVVDEQTLAPGLLRWTLSHPAKRNALSPDMLAWLQRRAAALAGEVVLLSGAGEPSFCAGFDLDALPEDPVAKDMSEAPDAALIAATAALRRADATFVAVLHGPVFGAGVELACCCDLRLARDDTRFTVPAARLGVVYHPAGVDLLERCLGLALTQRLLLLGDTLDAAELLRAGGLHGVHPEQLADPSKLRVPLLAHFADHDDWCTPDRVHALETQLRHATAEYELHRYSAQHAFFNEARPEVYDPQAATTAWRRTLAFLDRHLGDHGTTTNTAH